jgi:opacity protein-like surface antigen
MKLKTFFAVAASVVALASCGQKAKPVSEQLVGQWTGTDSISITVVDSTGNQVAQEFVAPIDFEYFADSTFTGVIKINDSTSINVGGVATIAEDVVTFTGSMQGVEPMDLSGTMTYVADPEGLKVTFTAVNAAANTTHSAKANLTRKAAPVQQ